MSKKTREDLVFDALLENLMSCPDAEILAEPEDVSSAHTLSVLLGAVTDFQHQRIEELRADRKLKLQRLRHERAKLPNSPVDQRAMLARLLDQQGERVTLQHRNLTEMTDEDIKLALEQTLYLLDDEADEADEGDGSDDEDDEKGGHDT